ncbi:hypothetical protein Lepto7375DRAFT_0692 [Leptolyngbya sp. PCC 7375]|nr:hypothetical protein Lepto7375DRAFT_0692 [Leptolyngbya sp. PCC 7375]
MHVLKHTQVPTLKQTIHGIVESAISNFSPGQVKIMGIRWKARLDISNTRYILVPGTAVNILERRGNTLLVCPTLQGIVEEELSSDVPGRIKVMGVSWKTQLCVPNNRYTLTQGATVAVFGRQGNTLFVCPLNLSLVKLEQ